MNNKKIQPLRLLLALEAGRRATLCTLLHGERRIQIVAEASLAHEALFHARTLCPDVAVVTGRYPDGDGLDLVRTLKIAAPACAVILLSDPPPSPRREWPPAGAAFTLPENCALEAVAALLGRLAPPGAIAIGHEAGARASRPGAASNQ